MIRRAFLPLSLCFSFILVLSACGDIEVRKPTEEETLSDEDRRDRRGGKIGRSGNPDDEAFTLFSVGGNKNKNKNKNKKQKTASLGTAAVLTNGYLWQAALDTIAFIPLLSSDFQGGVIATDWYSPPEDSNKRYRLTVRIVGTAFRSDALSVRLFTERKSRSGLWQRGESEADTERAIEDAILTRARSLLADSAL